MDIEVIKGYLEVFGDNVHIQAAVVIVAGLIVAKITDLLITRVFRALTSRTKTELDDQILALLHRPVFTTVALIALGLAFVLETPEEYEWIGKAVIITLVAFIWLSFFLKITSLLLRQMTQDEARFLIVQPATAPLFDIGTKLVLIGVTTYFVLLAWDINVTGWLASAGILGLAIGLAAQETLGNLFAGVSILADAPYKIGDYIVLDNSERGMVTKIGLRSTRILTRDQIEVTLPNSVIAQSKIINESGGPSIKQRVRMPIGVAYGSDVDQVTEILLGVAASEENVASDPAPRVFFTNFGASSLDFELRCWIEHPEIRGRTASRLNYAIYKALNQANIEIPFPQQDIYIKEIPEALLGGKSEGKQSSN